MLHKLTLTNFGIHKRLEVNFTEGLNVVRGDNETGKSTMLHAIAYALGGMSAVPNKTSADLATWGMSESSYKVELEFSCGKERYVITRSKSGAYLKGSATSVTGHAPVTKAVENLLELPTSLLPVILFTNQKSLADHVKSSTKGVIQQLAKLDLLDIWVEKIKANLPTGLTKHLEALLEGSVAEPPDSTVVETAKASLLDAKVELKKAQAEAGFNSSHQLQNHLQAMCHEVQDHQDRLTTARLALTKAVETLAHWESLRPSEDDLFVFSSTLDTELERRKAEYELLKHHSALIEAKATLDQLNDWSGVGGWVPQPSKVLEAETILYGELQGRITQLEQRRGELLHQLQHTSEVCTKCGQLLKDAGAIAKAKAEAAEELAALTGQLGRKGKRKSEILERLAILRRLNSEVIARTATKLFNFDFDTGVFTWVGGENLVSVTKDGLNKAGVWAEIGKLTRTKANLLDQRQKAKALDENIAKARFQVELYGTGVEQLESQLAAIAALAAEIPTKRKHLAELQVAEAACAAAQTNLTVTEQGFKAAQQAHNSALLRRAELTKVISETKFNNAVVAKLQKAKQTLSTELWTNLLALVSTILTQIRGVPSEVGMTEDQFTLDGQKWVLHSGSTQDSLGLAIRLALMNYFLPNLGFVILDEPGGAMSDTREGNMLSSLSQAGLDQVLLVTHSEVADSFAHNLIDLQEIYA